MSDSAKAVFLSYAREDADAARRIVEALQDAGVEVWFDESELAGGDAWDAKIRRQIGECTLFVPVISANTQARLEGYFRIEWKLAAQRTHAMAEEKAFVLPVVIDETGDTGAKVPAEFRAVQWTRFRSAESLGAFCARVKGLLSPEVGARAASPAKPNEAPSALAGRPPALPARRFPVGLLGALALVAVIIGAYFAMRPTPSNRTVSVWNPTPAAQPPTDFAPAKSVAVLPFANLSPDPENAFFADGVHEDVITSLAKIRDLKVISRTSTLAYREPAQRNLRKIAGELGVAAVLEGSVRRADGRVRVTAQLIDARTDQHLWAETYDRDLRDIFAVQAAVAQEIAGALKARLTPNEKALIERAITTSPEAYDLYLRAEILAESLTPRRSTREQVEEVIKLYEQALARDPAFAMAQARLAAHHGMAYRFLHIDPSPARARLAREATEAVERIAPGSPEASYARGWFAYTVENNWERALAALREAERGLPNDSMVIFSLGLASHRLGRGRDARGYFERAFALNPKDVDHAGQYLLALFRSRNYRTVLDIARRTGTTFLTAEFQPVVLRAQFALDGDLPAFRRNAAAMLDDRDAHKYHEYGTAIDARDFTVALEILSRADLGGAFPGLQSVNSLLVSVPSEALLPLSRAQVAWLLGDLAAARQLAEEARSVSSRDRRTPREASMSWRGVALAEAFADRETAALSSIEQAIASTNEASDVKLAREALGRINVILGRREQALAGLREMMAEECSVSPNEIRADPVWSRLKADPRFEEILNGAKPL